MNVHCNRSYCIASHLIRSENSIFGRMMSCENLTKVKNDMEILLSREAASFCNAIELPHLQTTNWTNFIRLNEDCFFSFLSFYSSRVFESFASRNLFEKVVKIFCTVNNCSFILIARKIWLCYCHCRSWWCCGWMGAPSLLLLLLSSFGASPRPCLQHFQF